MAAEWSYRDLKQNCTTLDFKRTLKFKRSSDRVFFISSVLIWSFEIYLRHGEEVSMAFYCQGPSIQDYPQAT
jgi:hypothetical protein